MKKQIMIAQLTKNMKTVIMGLLISMGMSLPTLAEPGVNGNDFEFDYQAMAVLLSDYLIPDYKVDELVEKCDCEVKIYNANNDLVRFGKANEDMIKGLITRSDFLIQVNGIKYYKLNQ